MWKSVIWSDENKIKLLVLNLDMFDTIAIQLMIRLYYTNSKTWMWRNNSMRLLFRILNVLWTVPNTLKFWNKTDTSFQEDWNLDRRWHLSWTMILSIHLKELKFGQNKSERFRLAKSESGSESDRKPLERYENCCSLKLVNKACSTGTILQRRTGYLQATVKLVTIVDLMTTVNLVST